MFLSEDVRSVKTVHTDQTGVDIICSSYIGERNPTVVIWIHITVSVT